MAQHQHGFGRMQAFVLLASASLLLTPSLALPNDPNLHFQSPDDNHLTGLESGTSWLRSLSPSDKDFCTTWDNYKNPFYAITADEAGSASDEDKGVKSREEADDSSVKVLYHASINTYEFPESTFGPPESANLETGLNNLPCHRSSSFKLSVSSESGDDASEEEGSDADRHQLDDADTMERYDGKSRKHGKHRPKHEHHKKHHKGKHHKGKHHKHPHHHHHHHPPPPPHHGHPHHPPPHHGHPHPPPPHRGHPHPPPPHHPFPPKFKHPKAGNSSWTILDTLKSDPAFSVIYEHVNISDTVKDTLSKDHDITFFAPIDIEHRHRPSESADLPSTVSPFWSLYEDDQGNSEEDEDMIQFEQESIEALESSISGQCGVIQSGSSILPKRSNGFISLIGKITHALTDMLGFESKVDTNDKIKFEDFDSNDMSPSYDDKDKEILEKVLSYHIVDGVVNATELVDDYLLDTFLKLDSLGGRTQKIRVVKFHHMFNLNFRTHILAKNIDTSNGAIQGIDRPLLPPPSIPFILGAFPKEFSLFLAGAHRVGLASALAHNSSMTVFAPTNSAIKKLGWKRLKFLWSEDGLVELKRIVSLHIAPSIMYKMELGSSKSPCVPTDAPDKSCLLTTLEGSTLTLAAGKLEHGGVELDVIRINNASSVIFSDGLARNGAIHVISDVLAPVEEQVVQ